MALPNRAVAPGPVGAKNEVGTGSPLSPRSRHLLGTVGPTSHPSALPLHSSDPCLPLAHFVALEHIGFLHARAEGHRSHFLAAPTLHASSRVSTAAIYSGRSPVGIRGSSASGEVQLFAPASIACRPWRISVLMGSGRGSTTEPRLRIPSRLAPEGPGATPPHRQFLLVLERPRELTEPNRVSRHPDHPPTTTVASTPLRTGARASRSSALRPVTRWPGSKLRGRRLLGSQPCTRTSRVRPLRSRGRYGSGGLRLNIRVQHSFGRDIETVATGAFTRSAARRRI